MFIPLQVQTPEQREPAVHIIADETDDGGTSK